MKIKITETIEKEKEIDVKFPHYYKHDLMLDFAKVIIYGYLTENEMISINEKENYSDGKMSYEIEKELRDDGYFDDKYESNYKEFEAVKKRALDFINNL